MKKLLAFLIIVPPLLGTILFGYILVKGPRMTVQHHFREFQMIPSPPPAGTVSVTSLAERLPAPDQLALLRNPLKPDAANLARGQIYYGYYCVFCHGDKGAGDGPVGHSYVPRPADLRTGKAAGYGDGDLLRAMLTGIGHEPVLERVVPAAHRWQLALYVRSLAARTR